METNEERPSTTRRRSSGAIWNILTFLVLLCVLCVVGVFLVIFLNPYSGLNPFPPPTLPAVAVLPSATPTKLVELPPTWTPTWTPEPTLTDTPRPTATLPPTRTPYSIVTPSATPTITPPPEGYPFQLQTGSPTAIENLYHPELGCEWMGVGGQVVDMSGAPVKGLVIQLGGSLRGVELQHLLTLAGTAPNYGQSGFEFKLADEPVFTQGTLWIQLLSQTGVPLSEKVYFDTYDTCDKNLIIINFKQVY